MLLGKILWDRHVPSGERRYGMQVLSARPRLVRWAAPVGLVAILAGGVGLAARSDGAAPSLPPRSAEQLLADVGRADPPGLSGTVVKTARLGLPALPARPGGDASLNSLVAGSHTARVWYAGRQRARVAVSGSLTEVDLIRNGRDVWTWESATNSATHVVLPEDKDHRRGPAGGVAPLPTTPEEAARQVIQAVTPTTSVRVGRTAQVADRPVYELVLAPKDARSLVDSVTLAVDGETKVPLRVRVFAKGQADPAFEVGFTEVQFRVPDAGVFRFTPPPGAKVTTQRADAGHKPEPGGRAAPARPAGTGLAVIGESWTSVVVARGVSAGSATGPAKALLDAAKPVQGAFGRGRLLQTPLVSALLTDDGRLYLGAVTPEALTAAAAQPASAARPLGPGGTP
jgi:outer membrane lipoprotein-sorting protein